MIWKIIYAKNFIKKLMMIILNLCLTIYIKYYFNINFFVGNNIYSKKDLYILLSFILYDFCEIIMMLKN